MNRTKNQLLEASNQVKNETVEGANTADRVGGILYDIAEHIQDVTITPKKATGTEIAEYSINGQTGKLFAPNGGGGEPSDPGYQRSYFLNVDKTASVVAPLPSHYQASNDTFVDTRTEPSRVWDSGNHNPESNQFTYAIWVYFNSNDEIITIDGPVNLMNGGGTNGEDGEEIEWAYIRFSQELTPSEINTMRTYLSQCKKEGTYANDAHKWDPSTQQYVSCTFEDEDAVPVAWEDNAQGVDDQGHQYEYAAFRRSQNDSSGNRTWGDDYFHGPLLWSAYGKQGLDGDGIEYIFYADPAGVAPTGDINRPDRWTNDADFQDEEYIRSGSDWVDNPIDLDSASYGPGSKQWVSVRKKKIVAPATVPLWQAYSEPALWSGVGLDGVVDGYTVSSDNPTMLVTTDPEGTVDSFTDSTTYEVFHNGVRVDYTSDPSEASTHFMLSVGTISRSDGGATTGISAAPASGGKIVVTLTNVANLDGVNISIAVVVALPNGDTRNSKITVTGLAASEGGYAISLYTGASNIRTDYYEQNVVPTSLAIGVRVGKGSNPVVYYSGASGGNAAEDKGYHFKYYYDNSGTHIAQLGPISVATGHSSLTVELYKDNGATFLESLTLPYVKDGAPGIGIAAVNYSIAVLSTSVALQSSANTVSGSLTFKVLKTTGGSTQEITTSPFNGTGGDGETIHVTINGSTRTASYSSGKWTASYSGTYNSSYPFSQIYVQSATNTIVASTTIPIIRDGSTVVQGLDAVVMRFRSYTAIANGTENPWYGNIQNGTTPYEDGVIYKDIIIFDGANGDNSYYYVVPTNQDARGPQWAANNPPANASTGQVGSAWVHFINMGDAAFQALLAKYAYIENLTANEIIITRNNSPVAGMTRGTAVDPSHNPLPGITRGNIRIWAGFDPSTGDLQRSKFYVTEDGFLHAENAEIVGSLLYHDVVTEYSGEYIAIADQVGTSRHTNIKGDIFIVGSSYSVFRISFPPAYIFPGAMLKVVITTQIDFEIFITRLSDEESEYTDNYNEVYNGFVNALNGSNWGVGSFTGTTQGSAGKDLAYSTMEFVSVKHPVHQSYYVWMLIDAK